MMKKLVLTIALAVASLAAQSQVDLLTVGSRTAYHMFDMARVDSVTFTQETYNYPLIDLPQTFNSFMKVAGNHIDYGWPSMLLALDTRGQDMPSDNVGYNWYSPSLDLTDRGPTYYMNILYWSYNTSTIAIANRMLANRPADDTPDDMFYRAQCLAYRAMCYFNLAQMYQHTYATHTDAPCVPLVTESNWLSGPKGLAPATVAEVYEQILADYTLAYDLLDRAEAAGVTRLSADIPPGYAKTLFDRAAVLGMRARVNLFMQRWQQAANDALEAVNLASPQGMTALTVEEVSVPGFFSLEERNVLLGVYDDIEYNRGIVSFASHMNGFMLGGYAGAAGCHRRISPVLYESMSESDVRRSWWLDGSGAIPATLPANYRDAIENAPNNGVPFPPYAQVKFGLVEGPTYYGHQSVPLLRMEELYLILAEALGMTNEVQGVSVLVNFVCGFRDRQYVYTATDFREEVWRQRRLEFWGEGLAYWDLQRMGKGIDRTGADYPEHVPQTVAADSPWMLYAYPSIATNQNPLLPLPETPDPLDGPHW